MDRLVVRTREVLAAVLAAALCTIVVGTGGWPGPVYAAAPRPWHEVSLAGGSTPYPYQMWATGDQVFLGNGERGTPVVTRCRPSGCRRTLLDLRPGEAGAVTESLEGRTAGDVWVSGHAWTATEDPSEDRGHVVVWHWDGAVWSRASVWGLPHVGFSPLRLAITQGEGVWLTGLREYQNSGAAANLSSVLYHLAPGSRHWREVSARGASVYPAPCRAWENRSLETPVAWRGGLVLLGTCGQTPQTVVLERPAGGATWRRIDPVLPSDRFPALSPYDGRLLLQGQRSDGTTGRWVGAGDRWQPLPPFPDPAEEALVVGAQGNGGRLVAATDRAGDALSTRWYEPVTRAWTERPIELDPGFFGSVTKIAVSHSGRVWVAVTTATVEESDGPDLLLTAR